MNFPKRFFARILNHVLDDNDLDIEFRCLHKYQDKDSLRPRQFWFNSIGQMEKRWQEVQDVNKLGYDIHFTVVPRLKKYQGGKEHPLPEKPITGCVWADLDVGEDKPYRTIRSAKTRIEHLKPTPSMIVQSGSGLHAYYLIKEPAERSKQRIEQILRSLTELLDGDKGAARVSRLMRVPNTINWKTGRPGKPATVVYLPKLQFRLKYLETTWGTHKQAAAGTGSGRKQHFQLPSNYSDLFTEHIRGLGPTSKNAEATGLCPFHDDQQPSFSVNLETGLWKCHSTACNAQGNIYQFCEKLGIPVPATAIKRFPRRRNIPQDQEWTAERTFCAVRRYITSQVHFTRSWQPVVVALWAIGTHMYQHFPCYAHLWLNSPTTHSGKTKLLDVLSTICYKATEPQLNPTPAVVFRFPKSIGGTLLLDEIDRLDPEQQSAVISVLNSYKINSGVMRNVPNKNKQYVMEVFNVYCPKVIAGINNLPETLQDRCLKIYLHRKRPLDKVERFTPGMFEQMENVRNQIHAWTVRERMRIVAAYQHGLDLPREADDRLKDLMEPLFAIATTLPEWVRDKLTEATVSLGNDRRANEEESNPVVLGVQALRENFPEDKDTWRLRSDNALHIFEQNIPTIESAGQAQALLRRFGLRSRRVRFGSKVLRAYVLRRKVLDRLVERYGLDQEDVA